MKLNVSFSCTKTCFVYRITQKISRKLWVMLGNGWICISIYDAWFVSIILNFNALSNGYTVQIQSYTVLLKSNKIFCLITGITFLNNFLTVSNEDGSYL